MQKMIISDLDGTLLKDDQTVSQRDVQSLEELGDRGLLRVIATGRSPFSFSRVIPDVQFWSWCYELENQGNTGVALIG